MKLKFVVITLLFFSSCTSEISQSFNKDDFKILTASNKYVSSAKDYLTVLDKSSSSSKSSLNSKFSIVNFLSNELKEVRITLKGRSGSSYGIASSIDSSVVLMINFNINGTVKSAAFSENKLLADKSVETKIYDLDGNLAIHFLTKDMKITVLENASSNGARSSGWFSDAGDCVSDAAQPFGNGILNIAFDVAATAITGGWYPVVLIAACAVKSYK